MKADSLSELLAWEPPPIIPIIAGGLLLPQTKMFLYGRYKSWKSMIAIHTAFCIAGGKPWFGFRTTATTTLMLQVEIPKVQYRNRVHKYAQGNNITKLDNLHFLTESYIKLDKGFGCSSLEQEIVRLKPGVVIVDPLFEVVSGRLTDEFDMRQFTDRMNMLMNKHHFALIIIHHDRKPQIFEGQSVNLGSQDMFGTVYFLGWCDTAIKIEPQQTDAEVRMVPDVVRHAEDELKPFMVAVDRKTLRFSIKEK